MQLVSSKTEHEPMFILDTNSQKQVLKYFFGGTLPDTSLLLPLTLDATLYLSS